MFENWENFYLIVGSGAGALIGLMFVVVTLAAGMGSANTSRAAPIYFTPIVFHFAAIVVVSAIAAVPNMPPPATGIALGLSAAIGFAYSLATAIRIFRTKFDRPPDLSDKFFYAFFPALIYLGLAAGACTVWIATEAAAYIVGAMMLVLLLVGIRNAWDLATFVVTKSQ